MAVYLVFSLLSRTKERTNTIKGLIARIITTIAINIEAIAVSSTKQQKLHREATAPSIKSIFSPFCNTGNQNKNLVHAR